jgi:transposase
VLTSDELDKLRRLRRELAEAKKANEILVKSAAFFAKEIVK